MIDRREEHFFYIKNTYLLTYLLHCPQNKTGAFVESMILAEIPILWHTFNLSIALLAIVYYLTNKKKEFL